MSWIERFYSLVLVQSYNHFVYTAQINKSITEEMKQWNQTTLLHVAVMWLGGVVVRVLDLRSKGRGFDSRLTHCRATTLGKLFTPMCLCSPSSIIWYLARAFMLMRLYVAAMHGSNEQGEYCRSGSAVISRLLHCHSRYSDSDVHHFSFARHTGLDQWSRSTPGRVTMGMGDCVTSIWQWEFRLSNAFNTFARLCQCVWFKRWGVWEDRVSVWAVSYTHLTLPTKRIV